MAVVDGVLGLTWEVESGSSVEWGPLETLLFLAPTNVVVVVVAEVGVVGVTTADMGAEDIRCCWL